MRVGRVRRNRSKLFCEQGPVTDHADSATQVRRRGKTNQRKNERPPGREKKGGEESLGHTWHKNNVNHAAPQLRNGQKRSAVGLTGRMNGKNPWPDLSSKEKGKKRAEMESKAICWMRDSHPKMLINHRLRLEQAKGENKPGKRRVASARKRAQTLTSNDTDSDRRGNELGLCSGRGVPRDTPRRDILKVTYAPLGRNREGVRPRNNSKKKRGFKKA